MPAANHPQSSWVAQRLGILLPAPRRDSWSRAPLPLDRVTLPAPAAGSEPAPRHPWTPSPSHHPNRLLPATSRHPQDAKRPGPRLPPATSPPRQQQHARSADCTPVPGPRPGAGTHLDQLLQAGRAALRTWKRENRNRDRRAGWMLRNRREGKQLEPSRRLGEEQRRGERSAMNVLRLPLLFRASLAERIRASELPAALLQIHPPKR
mmetsp:Transcript_61611/g.164984  ORF Transcript_61611/g.164984 Transcript_61611/m.164984 type:complete len:207 (+) Transcript_61611:157-777(+)